MGADLGSVRRWSIVSLSLLVLPIVPDSVLADAARAPTGPPPNDACVDAVDLFQGTGTCALSNAPCTSSADCTMAECAPDGADCTANASICDDVCENKVCIDGANAGLACFDDEDRCVSDTCSASGGPCTSDDDCTGGCPDGFCDGTCSRSGAGCFGAPGTEPQCAGLDACFPERCIFREFGSTVNATSPGEWINFPNPDIFASNMANVPGVWYRIIGTGHRVTASLCNPGTDYLSLADVTCAGCDRQQHFWVILSLGPGPRFPGDCTDHMPAAQELGSPHDSWCTEKGAEYHLFVGGVRNECRGGACSLSGSGCGLDEECEVNTCDGEACLLTGEPCTVDGDCPANECHGTTCVLEGEACTTDADCPDGSSGNLELTYWDDGVPCDPYIGTGTIDCGADNRVLAVDTVLTDDGDDDGWADSRETVDMRVRFRNHGERDLTGVVAELVTDDPKIAAISTAIVDLGTLGAGETLLAGDPFTFTVAAVDRASPAQDFAATFDVLIRSDQYDSAYRPQRITLDLDLDGAAGSGPTTFHEGFESGTLGSLVPMNLDLGRDTPEDSDGFRCQYDDPDPENPAANQCFLAGNPAHAEAFYWSADANRAFSGLYSLHMGDYQDDTPVTPTGTLEAVRSGEPINVGLGRVCSTTRTTICDADADCPGDESCVAVSPELSFKHQVSLFGFRQACDVCDPETHRCNGTGSLERCETRADCPAGEVCRMVGQWFFDGAGSDRGVVQAQRADADGNPVGDWIKLRPFVNVYDSHASNNFFNCTFDPVDDGNDEDDLFDGDRALPLGPSTTCLPEHSFNQLGNTHQDFRADRIGAASDGPGLEGESGTGTWVESRVSLARFRGQRVRLRFLSTSVAVHQFPLLPPGFFPSAGILGWWIDDVVLTDALATPATLASDTKVCEPGVDLDGDGVRDCIDCAPRNGQSWATSGAVRELLLTHSGGAAGTTLSWSAPEAPGAVEVAYAIVVRGTDACTESAPVDTTTADDTTAPAPGALLQLLVRADNACGAGFLGRDSLGRPREACP